MNETRFPKIFSSKFFLAVLAVILLILGFSVSREWHRKRQLQLEYRSLQSEIDKLENKNGEIATLIEYLKNDEGLEKEARIRLNLKKPGESVVVVAPSQESREAAREKENDQQSRSGAGGAPRVKNENFQKWREYFFQ